MKSINIALVGKTGHGKSSTGNTILQRKAFDEACNATDGTEIIELRKVDIGDSTELKIYDTPGLMSLKHAEERRRGAIRKEMDRLMELALEIHVFVFVLNFNSRFTKEEKDTLNELKDIFGADFLIAHGMVVVTHGDMCAINALEKQTSCQRMFEEWCKHAGNYFRTLKSEVGENILLVNNAGDFRDANHRIKSSQDLRTMIQHIAKRGPTFTREEYDDFKTRPCVIL